VLFRSKKAVISSAIERAQQTADVISDTANIPHYTNPLLNTWNIGEYDGAPEGRFKEKEWVKQPNNAPANGESFNDFASRMEQAYNMVKQAPKSDEIITHSKVTRAFKALEDTNGKWTPATSKKFISLKDEPTPKKNGGWLDRYEQGGMMLEKKADNYGKQGNYNDASVSLPEGFVGMGNDTQGRDYSPAWGGQFQMGGSLPGATGMMYARTQNPAPSNGKYAKKTLASAQNGKEMQFYQNGLDWTPRNISRDGSVIKDDRGQWAHPGEITEIGSNNITMQGVNYPVLGVSDKGDVQMMQPNQDYKFKGKKVTEYPMMQSGGPISKSDIEKRLALEQRLYNQKMQQSPSFSQYTPQPGDQERMYNNKIAALKEDEKLLNRAASSKYAANAMENIVEPMMNIEAGLGAGQLIKRGIESGAKTIGRNIINESSINNVLSNTKNQLSNALKGTGNMLGQFKGELLQGAANKKSIKEGNEWLKNWIDNPATQAKIDNSIIIKISSSIKPIF
jgi:hypothetical protein